MLDCAHDIGGEEWYVAISMVDADESVWKIQDHFFLESTGDGGLAKWVPTIGGEALKMWKGARKAEKDPKFAKTVDWERELKYTRLT